ncbi:MAG: hypothetical protein AAF730_10985 [Bacteroidota bacterium]
MMRLVVVLLAGLCGAACDSGGPVAPEQLVVEAFIEASPQTPRVVVRRSGLPDASYAPAAALVDGATVHARTAAGTLTFAPEAGGTYTAAVGLPARTPFKLEVEVEGARATASGLVPPQIALADIAINVPDTPVEAVLLEGFDLDSLGVTLDEGFIYPIEVTLRWARPAGYSPADSVYWVQTRLAPVVAFTSTVLDFFLLAEDVFNEQTAWQPGARRYEWTGVYAILVETRTTPLPVHELDVGLLRSTEAYARFARTRADRDRREPLSNVAGGLGIVAGIALDSTRLHVPQRPMASTPQTVGEK